MLATEQRSAIGFNNGATYPRLCPATGTRSEWTQDAQGCARVVAFVFGQGEPREVVVRKLAPQCPEANAVGPGEAVTFSERVLDTGE